MTSPPSTDWISISATALSPDRLSAWVSRPECGAIVTFCGMVRNASPEHDDVTALEYETSTELAQGRVAEVIAEARRRWPALGAVAIHHRIGRVELGECAVVVAVSSPHRQEAFDAALYCIDTIKASVPMWKREFFEGGSAWSGDRRPIIGVQE
ncbi:MAG: molybdenum cofactor biosynthesis protein MoaE [Acidimicrobiales bacterium]